MSIDATALEQEIEQYVQSLMGQGGSSSAANPDTYGADPTGQLDSSAAFLAAAEATGRIVVPPDGQYLIDSSIYLPARTIITGSSFAHFGNSRRQLIRGPNIPAEKAMFENAFWLKGLAFDSDHGGIATALTGYCCRTLECSFNGFTVAQTCPGGTLDRFWNNQYTGCETGIKDTSGDVATCMSFLSNHFQYCDNAIDYSACQMFNASFCENVIERVNGLGIAVQLMRDSTVRDNWFEHRNSGSDGYSFTISQPQQCWNVVVSGSHCQSGWIDYFARKPEEVNGMGGFYVMQGGDMQISNNTDGGIRVGRDGVSGLVSPWGDYSRDFVVESGRAEGSGNAQRLVMRSRGGAEIRGGRGVTIGGHPDDQADGALRHSIRVQTGSNRYHELEVSYTSGGNAEPQLAGRADIGDGYSAVIGVPAHVYFRTDGRDVGLEMFESVDVGVDYVTFHMPYTLHNPIIHITSESGGGHGGITLVDGYYTSTRRQCQGFRISWPGGVPNFWLQLMSVAPGEFK